jgi:hypothetical protein
MTKTAKTPAVPIAPAARLIAVFTPAQIVEMANRPLTYARKDLDLAMANFARKNTSNTPTSLLWAADSLNEVAEASAKIEVYEWAVKAYADPAHGATIAARLRKIARFVRAEIAKVAESAAQGNRGSASVANSLEASKLAGRARAWVRVSEEVNYLIDGLDEGTITIDEMAPPEAA